MQIRKQNLSFFQHRAFGRLRLLDLYDHVDTRKYGLRGRHNGGTGQLVVFIADADTGAGTLLHHHLMSMRSDFAHARWCQADAIFMILDFLRYANQHIVSH